MAGVGVASVVSSLGDSFGEWGVIKRQGAQSKEACGKDADTHFGCTESGL